MTDPGLSALVGLSAALARRNPKSLVEAMKECLQLVRPEQTEEVILQSYLFLGYPIALNAFSVWRKVSGREAGEAVPDEWEEWSDRGRVVCRTVYGGQYEGLRRNVRDLHPDMERWMVVEGYGKVLGRPGLPLATRELCIAGMLAVLGAPRQLYSHLRGALNAGAPPEMVESALATAANHMDGAETARARGIWEEIRSRWVGSQGTGKNRE